MYLLGSMGIIGRCSIMSIRQFGKLYTLPGHCIDYRMTITQ